MSRTIFITIAVGVVSALALGLFAGCPPNAYHVLTLVSAPIEGGTIVVDPDRTIYLAGTEILLTAVPNEGFTFRRWVGTGLNTTINPAKKRMYTDETIAAEFVRVIEGEPVEGEGEETIVKDGGFEDGVNTEFWSAFSVTGSTIICNPNTCGILDGLGAASGVGWAWFRSGPTVSVETATLAQQIEMPSQRVAYLSFDLAIPRSELPFSFVIFMDNTPIWEFNDLDADDYFDYERVSFDVSDFATGRSVVLTFSYFSAGSTGNESSVFVDNVAIN